MKRRKRIWFSLVLPVVCGCCAPQAVVQENGAYMAHTNFVEHVVRDSIFLHDSIFIRQKADTVFLTKYRTMYRENTVHDTVVFKDTVYIESVVASEVKASGSGWKPVALAMLPFALWLMYRLWRTIKERIVNK